MKLAFVKTPKILQWLFRKRIWAFSRSSNTVYLTFDDGPIPVITPWVLEQLKKHQAKATFFCIGDNIKKHRSVFEQIINQGHAIGNHTQHHINGWKTPTDKYLEEIAYCERTILENNSKTNIKKTKSKNLLRPPFGKMTSKQANAVLKKGYKIVMWDILSKDYDSNIDQEKCLKNVLRNIKPGSIVIFHDSLKAEKNLRYTLPKVLEFIEKKGWKCASI